MTPDIEAIVQRTLSFGRYLSWADLLNRLYEEELERTPASEEDDQEQGHKWRCLGLMCYWYGSLNVVVDAYDEIMLSDPVVDRLLAHPRGFRNLLRRYRNGVFHFQESLLDRRLRDLLEEGAAHAYWVRALHDELIRAYTEYLDRLVVTEEQRMELRKAIESMLHWYPYRYTPAFQSLERVISHGRETLERHRDDGSTERVELLRALESAELTLLEGRRNLESLRAQILREIGIE